MAGAAGGLDGFIRLAATYNVAAHAGAEGTSKQRFQGQQTIGLHEFLYPLAQANDSVARPKADRGAGGHTDQSYNLNVGREHHAQVLAWRPQVVLTTPLLRSFCDGHREDGEVRGELTLA
jgi:tyrosyl-tRNA synthetase